MSNSADLLVELLTEELPAKAVAELAGKLRDGLCERLAKAAVEHGAAQAEALWTPRRLAVRIPGVALAQPEQTSERRGPAVAAGLAADGTPSKALLGFAQSCGVAVEALEKLETDKGAWFVHRARREGALTAELLPEIVRGAIEALPLGKPMRWGSHEHAFLRPVHGLLLLLGEMVIPAQVFGLNSGRRTRGHRFHHPEELSIARPADYVAALEAAWVLVDPARRRERVQHQVEAAASAQGGRARLAEDLVEEVSNLTEWPCAIACSIPEEFMRLPEAVIVTTIETHQRFFPVLDGEGRLTPYFVGVANIDSRNPAAVRQGYERVVRPRLADAAFFYDLDLAQPLAAMAEGLARVTYQQKLGSVKDKVERVSALAAGLAPSIGVDAGLAVAAAGLSKADLMSRLVGEFPELQGQMGRSYALAQGLPGELAQALDEVYWPRQAGAPIAASPLGRLLAIAERADTLAGIWAAGLKPTGNKDPFALRRAALGLARTLVEGAIELPLRKLLAAAAAQLPLACDADKLVDELYTFILERTRAYYLDAGISADVFEAVAATQPEDLLDFDRRLRGVLAFKALPACQSLAAANKRIRNILRKAAEGGLAVATLAAVDPARFEMPAEAALHQALGEAELASHPLFAAADYRGGLTRLAELQGPVDAFFEQVMVMAEDPALRDNRLALLEQVANLFLRTAEISLLA